MCINTSTSALRLLQESLKYAPFPPVENLVPRPLFFQVLEKKSVIPKSREVESLWCWHTVWKGANKT